MEETQTHVKTNIRAIFRNSLLLLLHLSFFISVPDIPAQTEAEYIRLIQTHLGGDREIQVYGGVVDLVTDEYAIEVDWAPEWKEAIGQALWYGLQSNRKPGIVLIRTSPSQNKYIIQLGSALDYSGLNSKIRVWIWPDDFQNATSKNMNQLLQKNLAPAEYQQRHWITTSSKKRHNHTCRWYENSNGRFCSPTEGIACKQCGG